MESIAWYVLDATLAIALLAFCAAALASDDVSAADRISVLASAGPLAVGLGWAGWRRLRRPVELRRGDGHVQAERLVGSTTTEAELRVTERLTPWTRWTGAKPATALAAGSLIGPDAAPGSFDHLVD